MKTITPRVKPGGKLVAIEKRIDVTGTIMIKLQAGLDWR
ncbi:hypothetical protein PLAN_120158 [Planktothrix rubescens CCAP 1459/22]|jgi:hypothetical protein|uniref:Uncharacterized protein n=1 Tax=Planktothrix rubescens CCAP 1459/22 TaxID=329571 RepID=A0A6J7ZHE2_PLARU|nr:hypothetical protein PLAN_120158 [Planktothrix rubescens NIVA-CYA 18]CAD5930453.1 hypothetical protein NO108_01635 [Planktothrix rubescens]CAD5936478.1 hypothetical protein PCC7821_01623 [Planktothrix rubescens NIVA-CYA 18]CAH2572174.1 hypothetical protein PRNO82_01575 [Planktothrix rubescens]